MVWPTYVRGRSASYHSLVFNTLHPRNRDLHRQHTSPLGDATLSGIEAALSQNYGLKLEEDKAHIPNEGANKQKTNYLDDFTLRKVETLMWEAAHTNSYVRLGEDGERIYRELRNLQGKPRPNQTYQIRISFKHANGAPKSRGVEALGHRGGKNTIINLHSGYQLQINPTGDNPPQLGFPFKYWSKRHVPNSNGNSIKQTVAENIDDFVQLGLPFENYVRMPSDNSQDVRDSIGYRIFDKALRVYTRLGGDVEWLLSAYEKLGGNAKKLPRKLREIILVNEILEPSNVESSYSPWLQIGATLATIGAVNTISPVAIVSAQETPKPQLRQDLELKLADDKTSAPKKSEEETEYENLIIKGIRNQKLAPFTFSGEDLENILPKFNIEGQGYLLKVYRARKNPQWPPYHDLTDVKAGNLYEFWQNGKRVNFGRLKEEQAETISKAIEKTQERWKTAPSPPFQESAVVSGGRLVLPGEGEINYSASIRFGKDELGRDGVFYTILEPIVNNFYGITRPGYGGFIAFNDVVAEKRFLDHKIANKSAFRGYLERFFLKTKPTNDDYMGSIIDFIIRDAQNKLPKDVLEKLKAYLAPKNNCVPVLKEDAGWIDPRGISGVGLAVKSTSEGKLHILYDCNSAFYQVADGKTTIAAGAMKRGAPPTNSIEERIDAYVFNSEGAKKRKAFKGWLLEHGIQFRANDLEAMISAIARGFIPMFEADINGRSLTGLQFSGRYNTTIDGSGNNIFEGDMAIIFNRLINKDSMVQWAPYVQVRYDLKHDAVFATFTPMVAYKTGELTFNAWAQIPFTGEQRIGRPRHLPTDESTSTTTAGGSTTTTSAGTETKERTLWIPLKTFGGSIKVNLDRMVKDLSVEFGALYRMGVKGFVKESGNELESGKVTITRKKIPGEARGTLGIEYRLDLDNVLASVREHLGMQYTAEPEFKLGKPIVRFKGDFGKSGMGVMITATWEGHFLGGKYTPTQSLDKGMDVNQPGPWPDPIAIGQTTETRKTVKKSPELTADCPTTGTVGVEYSCPITSSNTEFRKVSGPAFLTVTKTGEHAAKISGIPSSGDIGTHNFEVGGKNTATGLESIIKRTVTISGANQAPTANAGADQTVNEGATVTLDSTASSDPDNNTLTRQWTQTAGPTVTLSSTTAAKPTFTAPQVTAQTTLTFSLIVNDGATNSVADTVNIITNNVNQAPTANAGADQTVNEGATVTLDSTASSDPDGDTITHSWTQISGPSVTLNNANTSTPSFTAPQVDAQTTLTFRDTVSDGSANSTDDMNVIVNDIPPPPPD